MSKGAIGKAAGDGDFNKQQGVDISKKHLISETFTQAEWYPPHPPRKSSSLYVKTHKEMIYTKDTPCDTCGVRISDVKRDGAGVKTASNPHGSKQLETHHFIIEWAESNGVDWDKVAAAYPNIKSLQRVAHAWDLEHNSGKHLHKGGTFSDGTKHDEYKKTCKVHGSKCDLAGDGTRTHVQYSHVDPTEFVDGVDQMKVLCDIHHRSSFFGIHKITFPIWQLQKFMRDDFQIIPDDIADATKSKAGASKKAPRKKTVAKKAPVRKKATRKKA